LKLSNRDKPHLSDFSIAELEISDVQVLLNKKDVVIFVVDVAAVIEHHLLGDGKEITAFTRNKRQAKLFFGLSNGRFYRPFSSGEMPGHRNIPQVRPVFLRG
jgi:hypothetical protein